MGWTKGKSRNNSSCTIQELQVFIKSLEKNHSMAKLSILLGMDKKTLWKWKHRKCRPSDEILYKLIEIMFPLNKGALPIYKVDMAIDGDTRVGGVSEYSSRISKGLEWDTMNC